MNTVILLGLIATGVMGDGERRGFFELTSHVDLEQWDDMTSQLSHGAELLKINQQPKKKNVRHLAGSKKDIVS